MAKIDFDLNKQDFSNLPRIVQYETVPAGRYKVEIVDADIVPTKKNKLNAEGHTSNFNLYVDYKILNEGEYLNKIIKEWFSIYNASETAMLIARRKLKDLTINCQINIFKDTKQLLNKKLSINIYIKNGKNEVREYGENI
jgi:hypothetical protein